MVRGKKLGGEPAVMIPLLRVHGGDLNVFYIADANADPLSPEEFLSLTLQLDLPTRNSGVPRNMPQKRQFSQIVVAHATTEEAASLIENDGFVKPRMGEANRSTIQFSMVWTRGYENQQRHLDLNGICQVGFSRCSTCL